MEKNGREGGILCNVIIDVPDNKDIINSLNFKRNSLMIRIDPSHWYNTGELIHPLTQLKGEKKLVDVFPDFIIAIGHLTSFLPTLRSSYANGEKLRQLLENYTQQPNFEKKLEFWEISNIATTAQQFETALKAELSIAPAYFVTPKGGYNIDILTLFPAQALPPDLIKLVPETFHDVEQASRCLAFEVPTAAAFHLHRLNESVCHHYWDAVSNRLPRPERDSLGHYIRAMEDAKIGEEDVLAALKQLNKLHRNPVIHPEKNFEVWEAIKLFGIIVSIIDSMLPAIRSYQEEIKKALDSAFSPSQLSRLSEKQSF